MSIIRFIICICLFIIALNAYGQEEAGCHCIQPPDYYAPAGVFIDHVHAKKGWMFSYRYMQMNMRNNRSGNTKVSADQVYNNYIMAPHHMSMQMHMLMLMYGLSDKLTFMGMTSYAVNYMDMSMMGSGVMAQMNMGSNNGNEFTAFSRTSGLTDTKIYALYELLGNSSHELVLSGGINIPTGEKSLRGPSMTGENDKYSYIMQPGNGNFAVLPGITYTWKNHFISGGTQLSSILRTGINKEHYRWGNEASITSWMSHSWTGWLSNSLRADLTVADKIKGYDPEIAIMRSIDPTADINNYGGTRATFYGGLNMMLPNGRLKGLRFSAEYGLPVYQNLNGVQMSLKSTLYTSLQYGF
ncbi:MAG TPA: hypothetical protein VNW99_10955 [Cytophagaceae bacterium]|nr:hypothetical protein [Cytophagaceae bacterium]